MGKMLGVPLDHKGSGEALGARDGCCSECTFFLLSPLHQNLHLEPCVSLSLVLMEPGRPTVPKLKV